MLRTCNKLTGKWEVVKNILRGEGANVRLGGQYILNIINNNLENFRGKKIAARRVFAPLSCGPD